MVSAAATGSERSTASPDFGTLRFQLAENITVLRKQAKLIKRLVVIETDMACAATAYQISDI